MQGWQGALDVGDLVPLQRILFLNCLQYVASTAWCNMVAGASAITSTFPASRKEEGLKKGIAPPFKDISWESQTQHFSFYPTGQNLILRS